MTENDASAQKAKEGVMKLSPATSSSRGIIGYDGVWKEMGDYLHVGGSGDTEESS